MDETLLIFNWLNDEQCDVYLQGRNVISMDHGPHGWDGMIGIRDALLKVAELSGWRVNVLGEPGV